jgi:hypothetical protein
VLALAGVLFGTLATQGVTLYNTRRKSAEDRKTADQNFRRTSLQDFIAASHKLIDTQTNKDKRDSVNIELYSAYIMLRLVADKEVLDKSQKCYVALERLMDVVDTDKPAAVSQAKLYYDAEVELVDTARAHSEDFGFPVIVNKEHSVHRAA